MKVFVLMYYDYDQTHLVGVFETKEKAEEYSLSIIGEIMFTHTQYRYNGNHFDVEEQEVK